MESCSSLSEFSPLVNVLENPSAGGEVLEVVSVLKKMERIIVRVRMVHSGDQEKTYIWQMIKMKMKMEKMKSLTQKKKI